MPACFCYRGGAGEESSALPIGGSPTSKLVGAVLTERRATSLLAVLAALLGATGSFVVTTVAMDSVPDTVLVGCAALVALLIAVAVQAADALPGIRSAEKTSLALAAIGGVLAFWAAPLIALSQRATDAPSGADTLFLTTSVWGLACVLIAFGDPAERPLVTAAAGALGCVAGAAGLLASWESPSSFSPFAKFPAREALMLVAGVFFAVGVTALARAVRRSGPKVVTLVALSAAATAGVLAALPSLPMQASIGWRALLPCIYLGAAYAVFSLGFTRSIAESGVSRSALALFGVPIVVMALAGVEQLRSVYGPSPVAWSAAATGVAVVIAGLVVVGLAGRQSEVGRAAARPLRLPLALSAVACLLGVASLATPALSATAQGGTAETFSATWTMVGAESAAGWLALAAAVLTLAAIVAARTGTPTAGWLSASVAALVCGLATIPLASTTLHTWNSWVPANVQQTYGTEYSRFAVEARVDSVRMAALVMAALGVIALVAAMRPWQTIGLTHEEVSQ